MAVEIWRVVPDWPMLEASSLGNVRRCLPGVAHNAVVGHLYKQITCKSTGYFFIRIGPKESRKNLTVHRLVCKAFYGLPTKERPHVAHKDGTRTNNCVENLYWASYAENRADCRRHGTLYCGEAHHLAKLRASDIPDIRRRLGSETLTSVAKSYGVSLDTIWNVREGLTWKSVP